jgi:hypothetical protein
MPGGASPPAVAGPRARRGSVVGRWWSRRRAVVGPVVALWSACGRSRGRRPPVGPVGSSLWRARSYGSVVGAEVEVRSSLSSWTAAVVGPGAGRAPRPSDVQTDRRERAPPSQHERRSRPVPRAPTTNVTGVKTGLPIRSPSPFRIPRRGSAVGRHHPVRDNTERSLDHPPGSDVHGTDPRFSPQMTGVFLASTDHSAGTGHAPIVLRAPRLRRATPQCPPPNPRDRPVPRAWVGVRPSRSSSILGNRVGCGAPRSSPPRSI